MNDLIKNLAKQAFGSTIDTDPILVYEAKQFAELIVQECAGLTLDYKNDQHYQGWLDYRNEIRKHFGIKE